MTPVALRPLFDFKFRINLNTVLLLIIIVLLLVIAYSLFKPEGIVEMLRGLYYTTNLG